MNQKTYSLNGHEYFQEELKFIQFKEIVDLLLPFQDKINLDEGAEMDMTAIAELLGDNFLRAVACVLIRKGESVRDRKIEETVADLEVESLVTIETIISDFFSLNDLPSHFGRITGIMKNVTMGADAEEKEGQEAQESTGPESSTQSATEILDE